MRININYVLDGVCEKWVNSVNSKISKLTENEIDFSGGTCMPHITLLMGEINEKDLPQIKKLLMGFKSNALGKKIEFSKPYINDTYVFVDVKEVAPFKEDCDNVLKLLSGLIVPHKYTISSGNTPHVTLGYTKQPNDIKGYLKTTQNVPSTVLQGIKVSKTGAHGTVVSIASK